MLAPSFKSADELGITEPQFEALKKTLVLLETGRLVHVPMRELRNPTQHPKFSGLFNMCYSFAQADCGTAGCIRGTAEMISGVEFSVFDLTPGLHDLFYEWGPSKTYDPSIAQAATALRSYLTTGDARWDLAVA